MNHADVHSHMADYLEGDLHLTKRALFDAHLDACDSCTREFDELRRTVALLRDLPMPEPPPFLAGKVMARIRRGEGRLTVSERVRRGLAVLSSPRLALPAVAGALALMLGFADFDPGATPGSVGPLSASQLARSQSDRDRQPEPLNVAARRWVNGTYPPPGLGQGSGIVRRRRPQRSIPAPPPAVARAPQLQIPLRGRSNRRVEPGIEMAGASGIAERSEFSPIVAAGERNDRKRAELTRRLDHLIRRPGLFAAEFAGLTVAEQEIWLEALAEFAEEIGRGQQAVVGLLLTGGRRPLELATAFAAELRRVRARARSTIASLEFAD